MKIELTPRERGIAGFLVDHNKAALNRISPVSPGASLTVVAIRQAVKADCAAIGNTVLKSEQPLTHDEFLRITRWINDAYFK